MLPSSSGRAFWRSRGAPRLACSLFLIALLTGCTRSSMPIPEGGTLVAPVGTTATSENTATEPAEPAIESDSAAIVWVAAGESLAIRETAGITGSVVTELAPDQRDLQPTGGTTRLGSSRWLELRTSSGQVGWVPAWNLTEHVPEETFCSDPRAVNLLQELRTALVDEDGSALTELLSPRRGLIIRINPWNPEVRIDEQRARAIFNDPRSLDWGTRFASQTGIRGSFSEIVLPSFRQALTEEVQPVCNQLTMGSGAPGASWPAEYANLNFYSLMTRPTDSTNPYNWRTWVLAFEYIDGRPYVAVLVQFRPQA